MGRNCPLMLSVMRMENCRRQPTEKKEEYSGLSKKEQRYTIRENNMQIRQLKGRTEEWQI